MDMLYTITVRDTHCGVRGKFVEEQTCFTKAEADAWAKQFRAEYDRECGYSVKVKTKQR